MSNDSEEKKNTSGGNETLASSSPNRGRFVFDGDKFVEGKAGPENIPDHLKELPSAWVTKEIPDSAKIHSLDPPHIVDDLKDQIAESERPPFEGFNDYVAQFCSLPARDVVPLTQARVDVVRVRVLAAETRRILSDQQHSDKELEPVFAVKHLWFEDNNVNKYSLREGNPPPDSERPTHMRCLDLVVDPDNWPKRVVDTLAHLGYKMNTTRQALAAMKSDMMKKNVQSLIQKGVL